jgi:hypothetical protein
MITGTETSNWAGLCGYQELSVSSPGWQSPLRLVGQLARLYVYASPRLG